MKYLQIGGAPGSVVVVGFFVYRWLNLRLTAIDTVLKNSKTENGGPKRAMKNTSKLNGGSDVLKRC